MTSNVSTTPQLKLGLVEFVALLAMLTAAVALSIDAMLPALPRIADDLTPNAPNLAQLIVTSFVLGLGIGTFIAGPLSDSFGRKPVILWGSGLYIFGCMLAWLAPSLELVIAARIVQGLGASAARIVPMAIVRDLYAGRAMARIVSFIMMVFTLVPAIAPLMGSGIIALAGWRGVFVAFMIFAAAAAIWLSARVTETLSDTARQPFRPSTLWSSANEVMAHPTVRLSTAAQTLCMTALFASLSSIHQIFDITYGRAIGFPWWFAGIALTAGAFSLVNASLVVRLGMRRLIRTAMTCLIFLTGTVLTLDLVAFQNGLPFALYIFWQAAVFVHTSMTLGNLSALALEPMGHIAGMAASVFTACATVGAVVFTVPIGLMFNGTPIPLMVGTLISVTVGYFLVQKMPRDGAKNSS